MRSLGAPHPILPAGRAGENGMRGTQFKSRGPGVGYQVSDRVISYVAIESWDLPP